MTYYFYDKMYARYFCSRLCLACIQDTISSRALGLVAECARKGILNTSAWPNFKDPQVKRAQQLSSVCTMKMYEFQQQIYEIMSRGCQAAIMD